MKGGWWYFLRTSLPCSHERASRANKDSQILALKNKINSYCCQRLIWGIISLLILSSQDIAAHVSSPQDSTTVAYQYIKHNTVWHTKSIKFRVGFFFFGCYASWPILIKLKALNIYTQLRLSSLKVGHWQVMLLYKDALQIWTVFMMFISAN